MIYDCGHNWADFTDIADVREARRRNHGGAACRCWLCCRDSCQLTPKRMREATDLLAPYVRDLEVHRRGARWLGADGQVEVTAAAVAELLENPPPMAPLFDLTEVGVIGAD